jgi:hypothetical protein
MWSYTPYRIALSLEGVEEYSHAAVPAFRVGGRKFASLASQAGVRKSDADGGPASGVCGGGARDFPADSGDWGRMGHTHIRLAAASEDVLTGSLRTAWKLRMDKNQKTARKKSDGTQYSDVTDQTRGK